MTSWHRVQKEGDPARTFMVLVVEGRVAACSTYLWLFSIGDRWEDARKALEVVGFTSVMVSPP